jgi:hypothetical protein
VTDPGRPLLRVVRGTPTAEELAALVAVLASRPAPAPAVVAPRRLWRTPLRAPLPAPGPGAWQAGSLPLP